MIGFLSLILLAIALSFSASATSIPNLANDLINLSSHSSEFLKDLLGGRLWIYQRNGAPAAMYFRSDGHFRNCSMRTDGQSYRTSHPDWEWGIGTRSNRTSLQIALHPSTRTVAMIVIYTPNSGRFHAEQYFKRTRDWRIVHDGWIQNTVPAVIHENCPNLRDLPDLPIDRSQTHTAWDKLLQSATPVLDHAHGADDPAAEARVGLEVAAKFPLDGSSFQRAGTPPDIRGRKPAPFLDAVEQGLAGGNGRENQRYGGRQRLPDMLDRAGPFDLAERRMDGDQPVAGDDAGQQDRHGLAVLATAGRDRDEGAGPDHLPALAGKAYVGKAVGHGSVSPGGGAGDRPRASRFARETRPSASRRRAPGRRATWRGGVCGEASRHARRGSH